MATLKKKQNISRLAGAWKRKNIDVNAIKELIQRTKAMTTEDVLAKFQNHKKNIERKTPTAQKRQAL